jgi:large subunit ribosomal protein L15
MNLSNLQPAEGSVHNQNKRVGRGEGSGKGGTSTRGHKGAKSRSGYSKKIGFEGGQMPLQRRVPKFGFKNINRVEYQGINLDTLQGLVENGVITETVDFTVFVDTRLATKNSLVKILGRGELKAKLKVSAHKFTATAKANHHHYEEIYRIIYQCLENRRTKK